MPELLQEAHLVISRSGASTVAELAVVGRPAIFIPYPFALDNHQQKTPSIWLRQVEHGAVKKPT